MSKYNYFSGHKPTIYGLFFVLLFSSTVALAVPPTSPYAENETLDPQCAPGGTNCYVQNSSSATWGTITGTLSSQTDLQAALAAKESALTFSTGLLRSGNTITSVLSTGVSGGQSVIGGTGAGDSLTLVSTTHATKGKIFFGQSQTSAYDTATGHLGIGTATPGGLLTLSGNQTAGAWGTSGINLRTSSATYTDSSSAASATVTNNMVNSFGVPTLAAASTSVTYTNAATLYIAGAPTAGTNVAITHPFGLYVDTAKSYLGGSVGIGTTTGTAPLEVKTVSRSASGGVRVLSSTTGNSIVNIQDSGAGDTGFVTVRAADTDKILLNSSGISYFNGGNVGIGLTVPLSVFAVNGGAAIGTYAGSVSAPTNGLIVSGSVGIATSTPGSTLEVKATSTTSGGGIKLIANTTGNSVVNIQDSGSGDAGLLSVRAGGVDKISLNSTGNSFFNTGAFLGIGNTAPTTLLYVGSAGVTTGTTVATFQNAGGTCSIVPSTSGGVSCSSDMTLKKNITLLSDGDAWSYNANVAAGNQSALAKVLALTPVVYNWNVEQDTDAKHAGFIAQEVRQVFPDLVTQDAATHLLSLNYAGFMPYTIEAIQEMNLNIIDIANLDRANTWRDALAAWLGNASNHITRIFTGEICLSEAGQESECLNRAELKALKASLNNQVQQTTAPASTADATETASDTAEPATQASDTSSEEVSSPVDATSDSSTQAILQNDSTSSGTSASADSSTSPVSSSPSDSAASGIAQ
jgi:hypothetical protein